MILLLILLLVIIILIKENNIKNEKSPLKVYVKTDRFFNNNKKF